MLKVEPAGVVEALGAAGGAPARRRTRSSSACGSRASRPRRRTGRRAVDGVVVARLDGRTRRRAAGGGPGGPRRDGVRAVVLGGSPDGAKVALAVVTGGDPDAGALVKRVAAVVGGGGGGSPQVAVAGGRDPGQARRGAGRGPAGTEGSMTGGAGGAPPGRGRGVGRTVALDLGERRIGVAVCDRSGTMAFPRPAIERSGDPAADRAAIAALVAEEEADGAGGGPAPLPRRSAGPGRPGGGGRGRRAGRRPVGGWRRGSRPSTSG